LSVPTVSLPPVLVASDDVEHEADADADPLAEDVLVSSCGAHAAAVRTRTEAAAAAAKAVRMARD
jgi:hypothetical protein